MDCRSKANEILNELKKDRSDEYKLFYLECALRAANNAGYKESSEDHKKIVEQMSRNP